MSKMQEFPTLLVASAASGIALCSCTYSDMMRVMSWGLGYSVFTHELAHEPTIMEFRALIEEQFPDLSKKPECSENWEAAAARAVERYGETISLRHGSTTRRESPIATLSAMVPAEKIIVVDTGGGAL